MRWDGRTRLIAKIIPEGVSVIDLGGGFGNLFRHLKNCQNYVSLDVKNWTDATIKADFNKGEFPDIKPEFQMIVCQGILEYIEKPEEFLNKIKKYGSRLLITYRPIAGHKDTGIYKNSMSAIEAVKKIKGAGWEIIFSREIIGTQKLFYCSRI